MLMMVLLVMTVMTMLMEMVVMLILVTSPAWLPRLQLRQASPDLQARSLEIPEWQTLQQRRNDVSI